MKSSNGGERHPEIGICELASNDAMSLDDIQRLISKEHSDNIKNGLLYATQTILNLQCMRYSSSRICHYLVRK